MENIMITMHVTVEVKADREVVVILPAEVPTGSVELVISIASLPPERKKPRTSLAEWAENNGEAWGDKLNAADVGGFTGRRY
jgi:hypothetical protein